MGVPSRTCAPSPLRASCLCPLRCQSRHSLQHGVSITKFPAPLPRTTPHAVPCHFEARAQQPSSDSASVLALLTSVAHTACAAVSTLQTCANLQVTLVGIMTHKTVTETFLSVGIYDGSGTIEAKLFLEDSSPVRLLPHCSCFASSLTDTHTSYARAERHARRGITACQLRVAPPCVRRGPCCQHRLVAITQSTVRARAPAATLSRH